MNSGAILTPTSPFYWYETKHYGSSARTVMNSGAILTPTSPFYWYETKHYGSSTRTCVNSPPCFSNLYFVHISTLRDSF